MNRALKISYGNTNKRTEFPASFNTLIQFVSEWVSIENDSTFIFKDSKTGKMITNDSEYQALKSIPQVEGTTPKLLVIIQPKPIQEPPKQKEEEKVMVYHEQPVAKVSCENQKAEDSNNVDNVDIEGQFKKSLSLMVQEKLQQVQNEIINEINQKISLTNQSKVILSSQLSKKIENLPVHAGKQCQVCKKGDIKGIRYKCTVCPDCNLCEDCERNTSHDPEHVLIKIRKPIDDSTIQIKHFTYINKGNAYDCFPRSINGYVMDHFNSQVKLTNTGKENWLPGFSFKCITSSSEITGEAAPINAKIVPGKDIYVEITFDSSGKQKGNYQSQWQMFNQKGVPFGEVTKLEITLN